MMKTKDIIMILCAICVCGISKGHETPFLNHYYDIQSLYNPASSGMENTLKIALNFRMDSVGIEGNTKFFSGVGEGGIDIGKLRLGGGLVFDYNKKNFTNSFRISANMAVGYRFDDALLSIGFSPGILNGEFQQNIFPDSMGNGGNTDILINKEEGRINSKSSTFDIGGGIYFSYKDLWLSVSGLHLTNPKFRFRRTGYVENEQDNYLEDKRLAALRTFYFSGGYNITLKKTLFYLEPSFIVSSNSQTTDYQLTGRLKFKNLAYIGCGWRSKKNGTIIAGFEYRGFHLAYSYNHSFATSDDGYRLRGHEIMAWYGIKIDLNKKKKYKQKSIRIL